MSARDDAEARIFDAVFALTCARVQERLPEAKRGLRARETIRERVPEAVRSALDEIVARLACELDGELEAAPLVSPRFVDGSFDVLNNAIPCSVCEVVRPIATLRVVGGTVVEVSCEACRPKKGPRRGTR